MHFDKLSANGVLSHFPKSVIRRCERSEAIQCVACGSGLPRRSAPRNDGSGLGRCFNRGQFLHPMAVLLVLRKDRPGQLLAEGVGVEMVRSTSHITGDSHLI
jgi:hypothetical protein